MGESVRTGRPLDEDVPEEPGYRRRFTWAMHYRTLETAPKIAAQVDLHGATTLLDLGGGPGTYSILLTGRYPGLRADVLELPGVAAVAREIVAAAGANERVALRDGDYHTADFGSGYDAVLMSGMFHRERPASCRRLIEKARAALVPGGLLAVSDVFTDAGGCSPPFAALFGLNMALTAPDGTVHADADVARWMEAAGFGAVGTRALPPPMPHRVVTGRLS